MHGYLIVYEKPNNILEYKTLCHKPQYKIGESNQYGWKVVDIKILNKGKALTPEEYKKVINKFSKFQEIIYFIENVNIKKLLEFFIMLLLLYYFTH